MALLLSAVKGVKNDLGTLVAPTDINYDEVIKGSDENHVELTGLQAGDTITTGEYFVGKLNVEKNVFVSDLVAVPEFTVEGQATVDNVKVDQADGKTTVSAE